VHVEQLQRFKSVDASQGNMGFLLADVNLNPSYLNDSALAILTYPNQLEVAKAMVIIQQRLRIILQTEQVSEPPPPTVFVSGSRHYVCRPFILKGRGGISRLTVALLLERQFRAHAALFEASRRFHLSPRESETVQHLVHGLTTKEIAQRMQVSPNTVKQFVRLVMRKVGGTTRSGIIGTILSA
jgi:DNA-binding CsgD family transcriptional regulator